MRLTTYQPLRLLHSLRIHPEWFHALLQNFSAWDESHLRFWPRAAFALRYGDSHITGHLQGCDTELAGIRSERRLAAGKSRNLLQQRPF